MFHEEADSSTRSRTEALSWPEKCGHRKRLKEEILKQDEKTVSSRVDGGRRAIDDA